MQERRGGGAGRPGAGDAGLALLEVLDRRIPTGARRWLARGTSAGPDELPVLLAAWAAAPERLGTGSLDLEADERDRLRAAGLTWPLGGWTLDELGRVVLLLLTVPRFPESRLREALDAIWDRALIDERRALLRALPLLPQAHRFLDLAIAGADSPIPELFEAIALDNPLPAAAFPDEALEAVVLRALLAGAAVDRIVGLPSRMTARMTRVVEGYARARAAGGGLAPRGIGRLVRASGVRRAG